MNTLFWYVGYLVCSLTVMGIGAWLIGKIARIPVTEWCADESDDM